MADTLTFRDVKQALMADKTICGLEPVIVRFDASFSNGQSPGSFHSWRGSYQEAAFGCSNVPVNVRDYLKMIEAAFNTTHGGWKGGEYTFDDDTLIWYGHEGDWHPNPDYAKHESLGLVAVERDGVAVVLRVGYASY